MIQLYDNPTKIKFYLQVKLYMHYPMKKEKVIIVFGVNVANLFLLCEDGPT